MKHVKLFENFVNEEKAKGDRGPIDNASIETGLKNKAKETGVPIGLLRLVMRRGMDAWNSGHRPGIGQEQWGYARVNAFLEKGDGTWKGADKDIAKEVRDGGHDKKLPYKFDESFNFEEGLDEMASSDVHYKEIMDLYHSGSFAKKKVAAVVCKNPNASQKQIERELADAGYEDMIEFVDALGIKESKDSDSFEGNPGEDKRMVDIRTFRGSVKDLTDFIEDKIKNQ
jgi:hypothetical protein